MSRPRIEPSEFDENDESSSQVKAGIFDIGKNIGLNSEMKRTFSPLSPLAAIGVLGLQAWRNSVNKKPYYAGMATFGFGKAALAVFLIESFRTINYRRYTRRQKMVELYYQEYKDELPHIGPGPRKYGEIMGDWSRTRM
ncbi:uncharacterized protein LOC111126503 [Crassostrea virginica]|uniref:Uncharacterized protein LOC111126120 n=1 Tax=Crassostrea virginica TaxID=6565 RepID=A0A8B8DFB5_CRAVI|nr:uncharacterized protein LOC111126120 [Crassostrea virginica]XP_022326900.1 uncharacterized protein LOC111126503 [Crassostrea virginica]